MEVQLRCELLWYMVQGWRMCGASEMLWMGKVRNRPTFIQMLSRMGDLQLERDGRTP